ncbi:MAG: hypothetical protein AAGD86_10135, partial [Pseudomonadota bacterium]
FSLGDARESRVVQSFHQWKLQRVLDAYRALAAPDRAPVDRWLAALGTADALALELPHRLTRRNNRLVLDRAS